MKKINFIKVYRRSQMRKLNIDYQTIILGLLGALLIFNSIVYIKGDIVTSKQSILELEEENMSKRESLHELRKVGNTDNEMVTSLEDFKEAINLLPRDCYIDSLKMESSIITIEGWSNSREPIFLYLDRLKKEDSSYGLLELNDPEYKENFEFRIENKGDEDKDDWEEE